MPSQPPKELNALRPEQNVPYFEHRNTVYPQRSAWCCWLEGLRRRRVAAIMQGQGIHAHLFIYIWYHMRCYTQYIDLCLYFCMGSWFHVLLKISANVFFFLFFSFKQCIVSNTLLRFCWDYTGRSALGQVEACHQKATRHHLKQCRTTDAYMRHRASFG